MMREGYETITPAISLEQTPNGSVRYDVVIQNLNASRRHSMVSEPSLEYWKTTAAEESRRALELQLTTQLHNVLATLTFFVLGVLTGGLFVWSVLS